MSDWSANVFSTDLLGDNRNVYPFGTEVGHNYLARQTLYRNLSEAVLFTYEGKDGINVVDVVNPPDEKSFSERVTPQLLKLLSKQQNPAISRTPDTIRSEEHTSELQSLMRISYAVFCLKKKNKLRKQTQH